jgi:sugar/nucleoside kinase (ribokinase family)
VLPALPYVDNLIINELEAGKLAGIDPAPQNLQRICEKLMSLGVRERVILHMPACGVCLSKNGFTLTPSFEPPAGYIKGKTGAGDAFCAGILYSLLKGLDLEYSLRVASCTAAMNLASPDSTGGACSLAETMELESRFGRRVK